MSHLFDIAAQMLRQHEGFKDKVYNCPSGALTIGFGHNLESNIISHSAGNHILYDDISESHVYCEKCFPGFPTFSKVRQACLIDIMFNLGPGSFQTFIKFIHAVNSQDWNKASFELLDSTYAAQVGDRAGHLADMLTEDEFLIIADCH